MWSSRLFWKMFVAYTTLILVTVSVCVVVVSRWQEAQLISQVRLRLHDATVMLRESLTDEFARGPTAELQERVRELGQQTDIRLTVVDRAGLVLADSERNSLEEVAEMENHLARMEFVQAARDGIGQSRRQSPTTGMFHLYHTIVVEGGGSQIGFVRAAQSLSSIQEQVASIRRLIILMGIAVALTCMAVTHWLNMRIVGPIRALTDAAEEMAGGKFPQRIQIATTDELGTLARSFEHMSRELNHREKQIRESLQRQMTVLSGMVEGVIAVDGSQHVLFANLAAGETLKFKPDEAVGKSLLEVVRSHELRDLVTEAIQSEQLCQREIQWQAKTVLTLDAHATPLPGDPAPGVVIVLHDVTELKRLEGMRQQFASNVSHELKTPLSSIKAYTETLLSGGIEDAEITRRFLGRIDEQADRLHELILDLLSIARIESGQAALDLVNVPLSRIVATCLANYEERARTANVQLHNEVLDDSTVVRADEEGLLQILGNLIDNAIKYTPPGGSATVRCRVQDGKAILEVADTGIGIAAEHHPRLFERFYRVDKARSRELGGTGLGLAIVKHLCQAMNGNVSVKSSPGKGSAFAVSIPLAGS